MDTVGVPYDVLSKAELDARFGPESQFKMNLKPLGPPRPIDHPQFGEVESNDEVLGGIFFPKTGCATIRSYLYNLALHS